MNYCKRYKANQRKSTLEIILETLWLLNCSRAYLASLYGVHIEAVNAWMQGRARPRDKKIERINEVHKTAIEEVRKEFIN